MKKILLPIYNWFYWKTTYLSIWFIRQLIFDNPIVNLYYDRKFGVHTAWKNQGDADVYGCWPSAYSHLRKIFKSFPVGKDTNLLDVGCGLGRAAFFIHSIGADKVTGIEINSVVFSKTMNNLSSYKKRNSNIIFLNCDATTYNYDGYNVIYISNPFPVHILDKVLNGIYSSYIRKQRIINIIYFDGGYNFECREFIRHVKYLHVHKKIDSTTNIYRVG